MFHAGVFVSVGHDSSLITVTSLFLRCENGSVPPVSVNITQSLSHHCHGMDTSLTVSSYMYTCIKVNHCMLTFHMYIHGLCLSILLFYSFLIYEIYIMLYGSSVVDGH